MLTIPLCAQMDEALGIASRFGLETDDMFKSLWLKKSQARGAVALSAIEDVLALVKDSNW